MSPPEARELVGDVERLLEEVDALADENARETATDVIRALLELYGAGLERIVEEIAQRDDGDLAAALAGDELVSHLLLLHGLHPVPLQERVTGALASVRPYLESHGGDVELLAVEGATVRLRLEGSCSGCPSSTMTLKLAIEDAIHKAAPEIEDVIADGAAPSAPTLLQIEMMPSAPGPCLGP
jgi:Fe-S cluster biogenesis protein NfuA